MELVPELVSKLVPELDFKLVPELISELVPKLVFELVQKLDEPVREPVPELDFKLVLRLILELWFKVHGAGSSSGTRAGVQDSSDHGNISLPSSARLTRRASSSQSVDSVQANWAGE